LRSGNRRRLTPFNNPRLVVPNSGPKKTPNNSSSDDPQGISNYFKIRYQSIDLKSPNLNLLIQMTKPDTWKNFTFQYNSFVNDNNDTQCLLAQKI
jgi:hypothetical protein